MANAEVPVEPPSPPPGEVTLLLRAAEGGDRAAFDRLFSLIYGELRAIARRQLQAMRPHETINTTGLVHEAYLKLARNAAWTTRDRRHFYALVARAMRLILIDHARSRTRERRGGGVRPETFSELQIAVSERAAELVALDEALDRLGTVDEELMRLVEWRFFAGLSLEEIAEISGRSVRTLKRHWQLARAFLQRELESQGFVT
jgi:RNA polymerase sigma factor (TIGR02999 family)